MTSNKPYLVKAIYDWCEENGLTPHILVDTMQDGVLVPNEFIEDNRIVLNISKEATHQLGVDYEAVDFMANFNQRVVKVFVPMGAVLAIYAYENGEGISFEDEDAGGGVSTLYPDIDLDVSDSDNESNVGVKILKKPELTIIK